MSMDMILPHESRLTVILFKWERSSICFISVDMQTRN